MDDLQIIDLFFMRNEQAIKETDMKYSKLCSLYYEYTLHLPSDPAWSWTYGGKCSDFVQTEVFYPPKTHKNEKYNLVWTYRKKAWKMSGIS